MGFTAFLVILLMVLLGFAVVLLIVTLNKQGVLKQERYAIEEQHRLLDEKYRKLVNRFRPVVSLDEEAERLRAEIQQLAAEQQAFGAKTAGERQALNSEYQQAKVLYDRLKREVSLLEENLEDISFGLYKPHYEFDTSEDYRQRLDQVRDEKKQLVRNDQATKCLVEWTVGGSRREGERMQKQLAKIMLRAFNGESDAAVANVRWNNITRMEERLQRAYEAINKLGTVVQVSLVSGYMDLALQELRLQFEYEEKRRAEAEEQRIIKERMREDERAQRELERAEQEAAEDELRFEKALERARSEVAEAKGEELEALTIKMRELEAQLAEKHAEHERAISRAQQTRSGHVYVLSNVGSFGENVFKIGMTRREKWKDRVKELSDASVPFEFDVHAMVFTEDAPDLEHTLHGVFSDHRVNLVNERKEFFNVSIREIEKALVARGLKVEITKLAEAREYRETIALRARREGTQIPEQTVAFPEMIGASVTPTNGR